MKEPNSSQRGEEPRKPSEKDCAEDHPAHTISPNSLRLIVITIRRALLGAIKLCDQLVEQLKIK